MVIFGGFNYVPPQAGKPQDTWFRFALIIVLGVSWAELQQKGWPAGSGHSAKKTQQLRYQNHSNRLDRRELGRVLPLLDPVLHVSPSLGPWEAHG